LPKKKAEAERIAKEKAEAERIAKEKAEADRVAKEIAEADRVSKERADRIAKERAGRLAKEKALIEAHNTLERIAKEEAEAERIAKEEKIRLKREEKERRKEEKKQEEVVQNRSAPPPIPERRIISEPPERQVKPSKKRELSPEQRRIRREKIIQAHQKRLQRVIMFMNQGSDMLKYNKGNKNASVKWVGLDNTRKFIGWNSYGKGKLKTKIPLTDITAVFYGVCTPNLLRHIGYTKEPWCCFSFRTKERTYDFVASSGTVATYFVFGIQQLSQSTMRHSFGRLLIRRMRMRLMYIAARNKLTMGKALTIIAKKSRKKNISQKSTKSFVGDELTKLIQETSKKPNVHAVVIAKPGSLGIQLRESPDLLGGVVIQRFVRNQQTNEMGQLEATGKLRVGMFMTSVNGKDVSKTPFQDLLDVLRNLASVEKTFVFDTVRGGGNGSDTNDENDEDGTTVVSAPAPTNPSPVVSSPAPVVSNNRSTVEQKPKKKQGPKYVMNLLQNPAVLREKVCVVALLSGMKPDAMVRAVNEMEAIAESASEIKDMKNFAFVAAAAEAAPVVKRIRSLTSLDPCQDQNKLQILLIDLPGGKNFALYPAPESSTESLSGVLTFLRDVKSGKVSFQKLGEKKKKKKKKKTQKIENNLKMSDKEFAAYCDVYRKMDPEGKGQAEASHIKVLLTRTKLNPSQLREAVITSRAMKPSYHPQSCESICRLLRIVSFLQNGGGNATLEAIEKLSDKPLPLAVVEGVISPSSPETSSSSSSSNDDQPVVKNNLKMSDKEFAAYYKVYRKMDPEGKGQAEASHIKVLLTRTKLSATQLRDAVITSRAMKPSYHPQSCESICRLLRIVAFVQGGGEAKLDPIEKVGDKPLPLAVVEGVLE